MVLDAPPVDADDIALTPSSSVRASTGDDARPSPPVAAGHPASAGPTPAMTIGMDDPSLADRLGETAVGKSSGHDRPALTYTVVAGEAERPVATIQPPGDSPAKLPEMWLSLEGDDRRILLAPAAARPGPAPPPTVEGREPGDGSLAHDEFGEDPEPETARGRSGVITWLVAVVLIAGFSALGWYVVPGLGDNRWTGDPEVTGPASGAVGLLICWLWLRWNSRRD
jgi:hypothetical protein